MKLQGCSNTWVICSVSLKKGASILLPITLPNAHGFSKLTIRLGSKTVMEVVIHYPTTPRCCCRVQPFGSNVISWVQSLEPPPACTVGSCWQYVTSFGFCHKGMSTAARPHFFTSFDRMHNGLAVNVSLHYPVKYFWHLLAHSGQWSGFMHHSVAIVYVKHPTMATLWKCPFCSLHQTS